MDPEVLAQLVPDAEDVSLSEVTFDVFDDEASSTGNWLDDATFEVWEQRASWYGVRRQVRLIRASTTPRKR